MNTLFFTSIASFFVCAGIVIALVLSFSLFRHRQPMKIMNAVWILTALWAHYFALFAYYTFGTRWEDMARPSSRNHNMNMGFKTDASMPASMEMPMTINMDANRPLWQSATLSTLHCGAGCTLADLTGELFTAYIPLQLGGSLLAGTWALDFVLALLFGVFFQFIAIREMETISFSKALTRAFKADVLSLTAWQIGMYGWMAIAYFVIFAGRPLEKDSCTFWFMMQIAMFAGFICSYPVNVLLIRLGIKKGM